MKQCSWNTMARSRGSAARLVWRIGWWRISVLFLAFGLWSHAGEVRYRVVPLVNNEQIGAHSSWGRGINQFGDVTGSYTIDMGTNAVAYPYTYESRPFVYKNETGFATLIATNTPFFGFSSGINDRGQVAFWGTPDNRVSYVYRYTPGVGIEWLGTFGDGAGDVASGINNRGDVVGRSEVLDGVHGWEFPFLYTDATGIMQMEGPVENFEGGARAINDLGHIALSSYGIYLYKPGFQTNLFTMLYYGNGIPYSINNRDVIVGDGIDEWGGQRATLYDGLTNHFLTPSGLKARALGINDNNVVVGEEWAVGSSPRAFLWTERDGLMWVNDFIEVGWAVSETSGINDRGQIAAVGGYVSGSSAVAVRLDPIPPMLSIQHSPADLLLSWSPNWPGVVLETTESLSPPDWQPVATGGTNVVDMPLSETQRFFRLNIENLRGLCCPPEP
jgi:uncharacterized membrane protein